MSNEFYHSEPEPWINSREASEFLAGVLKPKTVVKWARQGLLPARPIGEGQRRRWVFRKSEIEAWARKRGLWTQNEPSGHSKAGQVRDRDLENDEDAA